MMMIVPITYVYIYRSGTSVLPLPLMSSLFPIMFISPTRCRKGKHSEQ